MLILCKERPNLIHIYIYTSRYIDGSHQMLIHLSSPEELVPTDPPYTVSERLRTSPDDRLRTERRSEAPQAS